MGRFLSALGKTWGWLSTNPLYSVLILILLFYLYCVVDDFLTALLVTKWGHADFLVFDGLHKLLFETVSLERLPVGIASGVVGFVTGVILPLASKDKLIAKPKLKVAIWLLCLVVLGMAVANTAMIDPTVENGSLSPANTLMTLYVLNSSALTFGTALLGSLIGFNLIGTRT